MVLIVVEKCLGRSRNMLVIDINICLQEIVEGVD
jgi:hypothetical protein